MSGNITKYIIKMAKTRLFVMFSIFYPTVIIGFLFLAGAQEASARFVPYVFGLLVLAPVLLVGFLPNLGRIFSIFANSVIVFFIAYGYSVDAVFPLQLRDLVFFSIALLSVAFMVINGGEFYRQCCHFIVALKSPTS